MNKKGKKLHKAIIIILAVLCFLIIVAAVFCFTQKDNINAVITSVKYSKEDIAEQIDDSKSDIEDSLKEYDIENLRDFTFEEEEQIRRGEISYDEALQKIMTESGVADKLTVETNGSLSDTESDSSSHGVPSVTANSDDPQAIISEYTIKLYGVKAYYLGQIGDLVDKAKAEYKAGASLKTLATKYIGEAASLEEEADAGVDSLLSELESKLDAVGADTSVVDTMKSAYINEKNLKKSYYLSLYQNKG